jgi:hypothetical protein
MSNRYERLDATDSTRVSRESHRPSAFRPSRQSSQSTISYPDPQEMEAAFDDGSDSELDGEGGANAQRRLLGGKAGRGGDAVREDQQFQIGGDESDDDEEEARRAGREVQDVFNDPLRRGKGSQDAGALPDQQTGRMPGDYDFDRDYVSTTNDHEAENSLLNHLLAVPTASTIRITTSLSAKFPHVPRTGKQQRHHPRPQPYPEIPQQLIARSVPDRIIVAVILRRKQGSRFRRAYCTGSRRREHRCICESCGEAGSREACTAAGGGGRSGMGAGGVAEGGATGEFSVEICLTIHDLTWEIQSYATALRDAVPPYWETTVVLPSQTSPFGKFRTFATR